MGYVDSDRPGNRDAHVRDLGVKGRVANGHVRASNSSLFAHAPCNPDAEKIVTRYAPDFSKRTALYVACAHVKDRNGAMFSITGSATLPDA